MPRALLTRFFASILPSAGPYYVCRPIADRPAVTDRHEVASVAALIDVAQQYTDQTLYFTNASGDPSVPRAQRHKSAGAYMCRALKLDIDIRDGVGTFETVGEAVAALYKFCMSAQFCLPSWTILSGGGLHVYWSYGRDIPAAKSAVLASHFSALLHAHADPRLYYDLKATNNVVALLRVPLTCNTKRAGAPVKVLPYAPLCSDEPLTLESFKKLLTYIAARVPVQRLAAPAGPSTAFADSFASPPVPTSAVTLIKRCAALGWAALHQNEYADTYAGWRMVLKTVAHDDDPVQGRALAHIMSKKYKGASGKAYSSSETDAKFDSELANVANARGVSCATLCATTVGDRSKCVGCKFFDPATPDKGSPLQFARFIDAKPATTDAQADAVGFVSTQYLPSPSGKDEPVYPTDAYATRPTRFAGADKVTRQGLDSEGRAKHTDVTASGLIWPICRVNKVHDKNLADAAVLFRVVSHKGGRFETFTQQEMNSDLVMNEKLFLLGLTASRGSSVTRSKFLEDCCAMSGAIPRGDATDRFGWTLESPPKFVIGEWSYSGQGRRSKCFLTGDAENKQINLAYDTVGDFTEQLNVLRDYELPWASDEARFMLLVGLASPLMAFTEQAALVCAMTGPSGMGKTALLKTINSLWGKPIEGNTTATDTERGLFRTLGMLNNMPVTTDEITLWGDDRVQRFLFEITSGMTRTALKDDGTPRTSDYNGWKTLIITTANRDIRDMLESAGKDSDVVAAALARSYSVRIDRPTLARSKPKMDQMLTILNQNYGHIGPNLVDYILSNKLRVKEILREKLTKYQTHSAIVARYETTLFALTETVGTILEEKGWLMAGSWVEKHLERHVTEQTLAIKAREAEVLAAKYAQSAPVIATPVAPAMSPEQQAEMVDSLHTANVTKFAQQETADSAALEVINTLKTGSRGRTERALRSEVGTNNLVHTRNTQGQSVGMFGGAQASVALVEVQELDGRTTIIIPTAAFRVAMESMRRDAVREERTLRDSSYGFTVAKVNMAKYATNTLSQMPVECITLLLPALEEEQDV